MGKLIIDVPDNATNENMLRAFFPYPNDEVKAHILNDGTFLFYVDGEWLKSPYVARKPMFTTEEVIDMLEDIAKQIGGWSIVNDIPDKANGCRLAQREDMAIVREQIERLKGTESDSRESKLEPELKAISPNVPPKFANKTEILAKGCDEWYREEYECRYCGKHFMVDSDVKGHPYLTCCPCCGNYVRDIVRE